MPLDTPILLINAIAPAAQMAFEMIGDPLSPAQS
jgi:hypothetical protein